MVLPSGATEFWAKSKKTKTHRKATGKLRQSLVPDMQAALSEQIELLTKTPLHIGRNLSMAGHSARSRFLKPGVLPKSGHLACSLTWEGA
jgi:hypothetical protein